MMNILASNISCGVNQLTGVSMTTPNDIITVFQRGLRNNMLRRAPFILFSDQLRPATFTSGENFYKFILENKLGVVHKSNEKINPNSNNTIITYVWEVDWDAVSNFKVEIVAKVKDSVVDSVRTGVVYINNLVN